MKGEEELVVSKPTTIPYIEAAKEAHESSFQSLEMDEAKEKGVHLLACRIMEENNFQTGKGLGSKLQEIASPIVIPENHNQHRLGYQATFEEDFTWKAIIKWHNKVMGLEIPHIKTTFPAPAEVINMSEVATLTKGGSRAQYSIQLSEIPLDNWHSEDIPDVITLE